MTTPSLATAEVTMATWRGVTRTSYCPMPTCASCGGLSSAGTVDGVTLMGMSRSSPKPNLSACSRIASPPSSMPSQPKAVLHESCMATARVTLSFGPQAPGCELGRPTSVCGRSSTAGPGIDESLSHCPSSMAAAAVTILKTEPGG